MNDFTGGTSLHTMALSFAVYYLRQSFYRGRRRYLKREARHYLELSAPEGRLHIDGVTYYD